MKQFNLSEDSVIVVKKVQGEYLVVMKQKNSDVRFAEFTPNRYLVVSVLHLNCVHIQTFLLTSALVILILFCVWYCSCIGM